MSQEELIKEAKRRYPVGTKFLSLCQPIVYKTRKPNICIVVEDNHYGSVDISVSCDRPEDATRSSGTFIYYKDKWATIIPSVVETYPIY